MVQRQFCEEECILYAGDLKTFDGKEVVVAGTVFRSILVWEVGAGGQVAKVLFRLEGHTGVIFDVRFLRSGSGVVSVSDDRSIRVWQGETY